MTHAMPTLVERAVSPDWITVPARLNFTENRQRQLWGPPDQADKRQCLNLSLLRKPFSYTVEQRTNPYTNGEDANFGTWETALDIGRSYLVGSSVPMGEFLRVHTSSPNEWQRMAYDWCLANPSRLLVLTSTTSHLIYHICKRGEYVEIGLPHHSHGEEKYWVSRTGKTKVLRRYHSQLDGRMSPGCGRCSENASHHSR